METKIIQQIENLFAGADERDWQKVKSTMNDTVLLDYSSMTGNAVVLLTPEDISNAWAAFLPGFDRTHHQLSDFTVHIDGESATVHYTGNAEHFLNKEIWIVEGTYDTKLTLINGQWLITAQTLNFIRQSGSTDLPAQATQRMQAESSR